MFWPVARCGLPGRVLYKFSREFGAAPHFGVLSAAAHGDPAKARFLTIAQQLLQYQQEHAASAAMLCRAGRVAGGCAPDWLWFRQKNYWCDDGSYAIQTPGGLLVGRIQRGRPKLLTTAVELRRWARQQARKRA